MKIIMWFFLIMSSFLTIQSLLIIFKIGLSSLLDLTLVFFPVLYFISLLGCIYFFSVREKKLCIYLGVTILIASLQMKNVFPLNIIRYSTHYTTKCGSIKIMTWNVQGMGIIAPNIVDFAKRKKMIDLVKSENPDVLLLQEVVAATDSLTMNNIDSISSLLGYRNYYYDYRSGEGFDSSHHFGRLILTNYVISQKNVCERNDIKRMSDRVDIKRYSDRVTFADILINEKMYRFTCTHLESMKIDYQPDKALSDTLFESIYKIKKTDSKFDIILKAFDEHYQQVKMIEQFIDTSNLPIILCGDFNDVPNTKSYKLISKKLKDAHLESGFGFGRTFSKYLPSLRIDYIFVPKNVDVINCYTITELISDHYPVVAEVEL
jgi:endonuclease/exonuclease/phosphatase family metal-dependent hydrolase